VAPRISEDPSVAAPRSITAPTDIRSFSKAAGSTALELTRGVRHLRAVEFGGGSAEFQERYFVHRNEELALILEGRYVFDVAGAHHELGPGDTIMYSGGVPHHYRLGDPPHRFLAVIVHDDFDVIRHDGRGSSSASGESDPVVTAHCADSGA
jgi:uncharacterized cupin superfamily protein